MTKDMFWKAVIDGKNSNELMELYQQLSPKDQEAVQKEIRSLIENFTIVIKEVKRVIFQVANSISDWWESLPEDVKREFIKEVNP